MKVNVSDLCGESAISRPRVISILLHKTKTRELANVEAIYRQLCGEARRTISSPLQTGDIFWERCTERLVGEMFTQMNSNCTLKKNLGRPVSREDMYPLLDDWSSLLSESEQRSLHEHEERFLRDHGRPASEFDEVILQISQAARFCTAAPGMAVPCYTESTSQHMWIPSLKRWVTRMEKAMRAHTVGYICGIDEHHKQMGIETKGKVVRIDEHRREYSRRADNKG